MVVIATITIMEAATTMAAQMILSAIKVQADTTTAINIITVDLEEVAMVTLEEIKLQHRSETSKCSKTQHVIKPTMLALQHHICSRCRVELNRAMRQQEQLPLQTTQATTPNTMAIKLQRELLQAMFKVELLSTITGSIISMTRVPQLQPPQPNNSKHQLPITTTTTSNTTTTITDSSSRLLNTAQPLYQAQLRLHKLQPCSSQVRIIKSLLNRQKATKITTRLNEPSIEV